MKIFLLSWVLFSSSVFADSSALTADFLSLLGKHGITPSQEQAYCYLKDGVVAGHQPKKLQRIASITKILTTYFASELLDLHKTYETRFFLNGEDLHIQGGADPYWEEEKILLLMQSLNDRGIKKLRRVTFDRNFIFSDVAFRSHADVTPAYTRSRLVSLWSAAGAAQVRTHWNTVNVFAIEEGIVLTGTAPVLTASSIQHSDINPFQGQAPAVLVHRSLPLHRILKSMNVMSKNHVAQNLFRESSQIKAYEALMQERGFSPSDFRIYNGSGLPLERNNTRLDNLSTCESILRISMALEQSLKKHNLVLSDVIAVNGGKDLGSFRNRFLEFPETHQAVLSKTGTLMHTSSLAGILRMDETLVPFAVLNHTGNTASARSFQDAFVARMFHHLGDPSPLDYTKISIFPWDNSEFLTEAVLPVLFARN